MIPMDFEIQRLLGVIDIRTYLLLHYNSLFVSFYFPQQTDNQARIIFEANLLFSLYYEDIYLGDRLYLVIKNKHKSKKEIKAFLHQ